MRPRNRVAQGAVKPRSKVCFSLLLKLAQSLATSRHDINNPITTNIDSHYFAQKSNLRFWYLTTDTRIYRQQMLHRAFSIHQTVHAARRLPLAIVPTVPSLVEPWRVGAFDLLTASSDCSWPFTVFGTRAERAMRGRRLVGDGK
jgi:hypothetical protein